MDKNVRKNPFGNTPNIEQSTAPVKREPVHTQPPKVDNTKTTAPPKFRGSTTSEEANKSVPDVKPTPRVNTDHYSDESSDLINKEYEGLKQFNTSKSFLRLTTER
jgi:hypothetical protein